MKTFALALGGGGARGLAHIAVIEALDEMGVKPAAIAGTSIGALVGAAYAAGMRGKDIRHHVIALAHDRGEIRRRLMRRAPARSPICSPAPSARRRRSTRRNSARNFCPKRCRRILPRCEIPLTVMATDLHRRQEVRLSRRGRCSPALAASIAIPGLFRPVVDRRPHSDRRRRHQSAAVRSA